MAQTQAFAQATDKQVDFITKLIDERLAKKADGTYGDKTVAAVVAEREGGIPAYLERVRAGGKKAASVTIDKLLAAPKAAKPKTPRAITADGAALAADLRQSHQAMHDTGECFCVDPTGEKVKRAAVRHDVPAGHYAVDSPREDQDTDFYRVDRPTDGKWAGMTFVKRVIGGHPDVRVRGAEATDALKRILEAGVMPARVRYGNEIGACARCNRHLTDELSRRRGIGPDCWTREGWSYDDSDIINQLLREGVR